MLWTPAQRGAELIAWFDADPAYTTLVTDSVAAWLDRSGNGRHLSQGTAPNRLGYSASDAAYGNRPVLLGTGSGSLDADAAWSIAQPVTVYLVGESGTNADWKTFIDDKVGDPRVVVRADPTEQGSIYAGTANVTGTTLANAPAIMCAVFNGASSALYIGSTTAAVSDNPGSQGLSQPRVGLAAPGPSYSAPAGWKMNRLLFFSGADDSAKRRQVLDYLSRETGLSVTGL